MIDTAIAAIFSLAASLSMIVIAGEAEAWFGSRRAVRARLAEIRRIGK